MACTTSVETISKVSTLANSGYDIGTIYALSDYIGVSIDDLSENQVAALAARDFDSISDFLKTGDVVLYDDTNIGIKLSDGSIQELNISAKAYKELFADGTSYLDIKQGRISDCYLVSTIYELYSNPATRYSILQCFTENTDGSITVKLKNGNVEFTFDAAKNMSDYIDTRKISSGSEGVAMLEYVYGLELVNNSTKIEQDNLAFLNKYAEFYDSVLKTEGTDVDINSLYKQIDDLFGTDRDYHSLLSLNNDGSIDYSTIKTNLDSIQKNISDVEKTITDLSIEARDKGGCMFNVYKMILGGDTGAYLGGSNEAKNLLLNSDNWSEYIFGAGTKGDSDTKFLNRDLNIVGWHAYSIVPKTNADGEIVIEITNPMGYKPSYNNNL